jgi:hypothetical protein
MSSPAGVVDGLLAGRYRAVVHRLGAGAAVLGLAGRPGQRRAVRATALALGLLALALGVRDGTDDGASRELQSLRPAASAPAASEPAR